MRIESALFASREGLQAHGQAISVIGDNISNANTTAFKESRIEFGDLLPDGIDGRQSTTLPNAGAGVRVTAVRSIFTDGVIDFTGRGLDIALDGNGFLITGSEADPTYSRAGNLTIDPNGLLATADGTPILGFQGTGTTLGQINMNNIASTSAATTNVSMVGNYDATTAIGTAPANPASYTALAGNAGTIINNITVYDSLGVAHDITVATTKTGTNTWVAQAYINADEVGGTVSNPPVPQQIGANVTLNFQSDGTIAAADQANALITATPAYSGGAAAGNFTIDLSKFSQYGAQSSLQGISGDGQGAGQVESYEFAKDGTITALLSTGSSVVVGKLQLADFANRDGLVRAGNSGYKATDAAGAVTTGSPTELGLGGIQHGALERSTVDIAGQFVDLVMYQRGYQANSQTLSATNEILRDTLGLIR